MIAQFFRDRKNIKNNNKYHDMLDKSFEVLNSVSKKCDDENAKTRGGIYYYMNKDEFLLLHIHLIPFLE